jgi:amino acid adenylation domain-containing protein
VPFERVVHALQPQRDLAHTPLFQVMFAFQSVDERGALRLDDLSIRAFEADVGASEYDLFVGASEGPSGLSLTLYYDADLFDAATIAAMADQYVRLLLDAASAPDAPISVVRLLDAGGEREVEQRAHGAAAPAITGAIHEVIRQHAADTPSLPAIIRGDQRVSYAALDESANAVAHRLSALAVGPEVRVGIAAVNSPAALAAVLGVLKTGAAFVTIDPAWPPARVAHVVNEANVRVMLASGEFCGAARAAIAPDMPVLAIEDHAAAAAFPSPAVLPEQLAYVMYTSGSTGTPKGVMVAHGSLHWYAAAAAEIYAIAPADRVLWSAPLTSDIAIEEVFSCLLAGGTLVLQSAPAMASIHDLLDEIRRQSVTVMCLPTVLWTELAAAVAPGQLPSSVRLVTVGGSAMPADRVVAWFDAAAPGSILINGYGPTETTVCASWAVVPVPKRSGSVQRIAIGRPLPCAAVYVLDTRMQLAPPGVPGEIFIGGCGVARGYASRPDLTAERFVPDPFSRVPGHRLYRTGDRGRYRHDGELEFLGRLDNEIKVRGYRVSPEELEHALIAHPDVADAAAVAPDGHPDNALIAYVQPAPGRSLDRESVLRHLRGRLPDYLVPAHVVAVPELPRTAHGKIDRRALQSIEPPRPATAAGTAVFTPTERAVADIWRELLGVAPSATDNFFALGGHSLLALRVVARIAAVLGMNVPLRVLFERPSVAGLAQYIEAMQWLARTNDAAGTEPA